MRNLLAVCAALAVTLGIVSGNLWFQLRSARHQIVGLQGELADAKASVVPAAQAQLPPAVAAPSPPSAAMQQPEPVLPPPPAPALASAPRDVVMVAARPERPLGLPTLTTPLAGNTDDERRVEALAQSDRTAAARVTAWNTALHLTPEQVQVLNDITRSELRRETEDSLRIASNSGSLDARSAARLKVETVARQHETLLRILEQMSPQLTAQQNTQMSTMFEGWLRNNMARARAEEEAVLSAL